ncbi:MAG: hypothetical protein PQJ58_10215, partial [Spirochaetales bacterium]|nr:hypothetical protein [Spirochaetales bacterium]
MIPRTGIILLLSLLLLLSGCTRTEDTIKVYSDRPEVAELVNLFNQSQDLYTAVFTYTSGTSEEPVNPGLHDIVIAGGLHSSRNKERLSDLNSLRNSSFVKSVYPELLKTGITGTSLRAIPLSASLPVIISGEKISRGKYISWSELSDFASGFNIVQEDSLRNTGFSPLWSEVFVTSWYNNSISSYSTEVRENSFRDFDRLSAELKQWIIENNGSMEMCRAFSDKYRYIPDYRLIINGRIACTVLSLEEWALLPDTITRELTPGILKFEEGLQSTEILSAGIPAEPANPEGALIFMNWLLEESTWEDYLTLLARSRDESFAFLGGISASEKLNTGLLLRYYPWMEPYAPRAGEWSIQPEVETQWPLVWDKLLLPLVM